MLINVISSWLSQLILLVTGFFLPRLIDEQLGQFSLGVWDFTWSVVSYMNLANLGIGSALNRFISNYRSEGKHELITEAASTVIAIQIVLAILAALFTLVIAHQIPIHYSERFGEEVNIAQGVVLFLGLSVAAQFVFDTSRGILTGLHRWDLFNGINTFFQVTGTAAMIATLFAGGSLVSMSIVYLIMICCQGLIRSIVALKLCPESKFRASAISLSFGKTIFSFGIKIIMIGISPIIIIQGCYIIIASTLGPASLAIFARPASLIKQLETFVNRFTFILTPMAGPILTIEGTQELKKFVIGSARCGLAFTLPIITLFCFYGPELIRMWMGEDYVNTTIIYLLGLGFLLPISQSSVIRVLIGLDLHGTAAWIAAVSSLILVTMGLSSIWWLGEPSLVSYASVLVICLTLVNGIFLPIYSCVKLEISLIQYFQDVFVKVFILSGVCTGILYLINSWLDFTGAGIFIGSAIYLLICGALYWQFLLDQPIRQKLLQKIKR